MYNGIGLPTPRGTGTNGFVQRSLSHRVLPSSSSSSSQSFASRTAGRPSNDLPPPCAPPLRPVNRELMQHERRREVELECFKLRLQLQAEFEKKAAGSSSSEPPRSESRAARTAAAREEKARAEIDAQVDELRKTLTAKMEDKGPVEDAGAAVKSFDRLPSRKQRSSRARPF